MRQGVFPIEPRPCWRSIAAIEKGSRESPWNNDVRRKRAHNASLDEALCRADLALPRMNRLFLRLSPSPLLARSPVSGFLRFPTSGHYRPGKSIFSSSAAFRSLFNARASICRIRSLVTPNSAPTSLSVKGSRS